MGYGSSGICAENGSKAAKAVFTGGGGVGKRGVHGMRIFRYLRRNRTERAQAGIAGRRRALIPRRSVCVCQVDRLDACCQVFGGCSGVGEKRGRPGSAGLGSTQLRQSPVSTRAPPKATRRMCSAKR